LKASKNNYSLKDYNKASHAFGVASHYIADSFISPHYISKEPGSLHTEFEKIKDYKIRINCYNSLINLNESLKEASRNKEDWTNWTLTKNPEIPKREFEQAANLSMLIFLKIFNSSCNNLETEIIKKDFRINKDIIIFLFLILISYLTFIFNKKYKLIKRIKF
jgi:hypothetical protein